MLARPTDVVSLTSGTVSALLHVMPRVDATVTDGCGARGSGGVQPETGMSILCPFSRLPCHEMPGDRHFAL